MQFAEDGDQLLLTYFREFYQQVSQLEQMINSLGWQLPQVVAGERIVPASDNGSASLSASNNAGEIKAAAVSLEHTGETATMVLARAGSCAEIQQRLLFFLEHQERRARADGCQRYKEAQYVMASLADEHFLNLNWTGKEDWLANLLESKLFHTHAAGQDFFNKLGRLLQERDPGQRELACIYLMALSLGFRGKFNGSDDRGQIARYRQQLFLLVFNRRPNFEKVQHLFPDAYLYTLRQKRRRRLPRLKIWLAALCLAVLAYIGVSHVLWAKLVTPLETLNEEISTKARFLSGKGENKK